jgi:iron complex outermembrane receptor protein
MAAPIQMANAQNDDSVVADDEKIEEIIATGSRLLGAGRSTSPLQSVGQLEIQANPATNLADFLVRNITANNGNLTIDDESNLAGRNIGDRSTGVNLWSLGEENTLTLLNGSRLVNSAAPNNNGWYNVDFNSIIPSIATQRIDVLLDGGSAIYGTDAVAGVVNVTPRYGYEGFEARFQTELFPDALGDTSSIVLEFLWGTKFSDGRGSFVTAFDYRETYINDAEELGLNHGNVPQFTGSETIEDFEELLFVGGDSYDYLAAPPRPPMGPPPPGIALADPLCGRDDLVDAPYYFLGEIVPAGATDPADSGTCAGYPLPDIDGRETERYTIFAALSYDFTDRVSGSIEAGYGEREVNDFRRTVTNSGSPFSNQSIPATHPSVLYYQTIDPVWASAAGIDLLTDIPAFPINWGGFGTHDSENTNVHAALDFEISDRVSLKIGANYGQSDSVQMILRQNEPNYLNAVNGLGGSGCDPATGTPGVGGCEYYNPFISAMLPDAASLGLANSDELVQWLLPGDSSGVAERIYATEITSIDALFEFSTGWELGGGEVDLVVGAESRTEKASIDFSEAYLAGDINGADALIPFSGKENVYALFAEAILPLSETFSVQLAARYEDYDSVGDTTNPKIGLLWEINDRVTLRSSYGTSFKAPTILHTNDTFGTAQIPTGPGAGRRGGQPVNTIIKGDPDITPQTADHFSIGGDFVLLEDKGSLRNLNFNVSYVQFKFDDRITRVDELDRMPNAEGSGTCGVVNAANQYSEFFYVGTDGLPCYEGTDTNANGILEHSELTDAYRTFINLASADLDGIDFRFLSTFETGVGNLNVTLGGTYILAYEVQDNPLEPPVDAVGHAGVLGAGTVPMSEWRINGALAMRWGSSGSHNTNFTGRYASEIVNDADELVTGDQIVWDLRHNWNIIDYFSLGLTVNNIFENAPNRPNATVPPVRDGVRSFFVNLSLAFDDG